MKTIIKNEHAQAGVGTLIIFIAMVLVAAVAAAVLIQTSGVMQSKSTTTTKEAAEAVTESIVIDSVSGDADTSSAILNNINITVRIGPGSGDINASKLVVMVKGQQIAHTVTGLRNVGADAMLRSGSLASLGVGVNSLNLVSKDAITISITPEKGTTINMPITLPIIDTSATGIALYP